MTKGSGKRKRDAAKDLEQDYGLITDTDYHTRKPFSRNFQQTYEEYSSDQSLPNEVEQATWMKVKHSGLPAIALQLAIFPYPNMVAQILSCCTRDGVLLKKDGTPLVSFSLKNYTFIYRMPAPEINIDDGYMKNFSDPNKKNRPRIFPMPYQPSMSPTTNHLEGNFSQNQLIRNMPA